MLDDYVKRTLQAPVYDVAEETPVHRADTLSRRLGNTVLLKREDLQPVFSFKLRGAYTALAKLDAEQAGRGVIAASAGNHAQGLAMAAGKLGIKATIVMPRPTPQIKVDSVRALGGRVVLEGDTFEQASLHAHSLAEERSLRYVHPYDDVDVIAGQGTVAMEILRQVRGPLDAVFVPVGGGGLIAGMAAYIKAVRPEIKVIGVEPEDAACLQAALQKGRRVQLPQVGIFAEGVAVAQIGKEPFRIARKHVDAVITVTTDEMCAAIKDIFQDTRSIAEPAGALSLAGMKKYIHEHKAERQTLLSVVSGANTNFDRLRYIAERTDVGEQAEAVLAVTIPEQPGSFKAFCKAVGKRNITEFNYRFAGNGDAHIFVGIKVSPGGEDRSKLIDQLQRKAYSVHDLTNDELAKSHIRYMVGGSAPEVANERVFRVMFPERPGALLGFLEALNPRWNISLFHYRNHGAAYGRIMLGLQIAPSESSAFKQCMAGLPYDLVEETTSEAYQLFLK